MITITLKSMVFYQWTWARQQAFCCCLLFVNSVGSTMEHREKLLQYIIKYRSILLLVIVLLWIWFSDLNTVYSVNLVGRESDDMVSWYLRFSYNLGFWMVFSLPTYVGIFLVIGILHEGRISVTSGHWGELTTKQPHQMGLVSVWEWTDPLGSKLARPYDYYHVCTGGL